MSYRPKRLVVDEALKHAKTIARVIPNYRFVAYGEYIRDRLLNLYPRKINLFTSASVDLISNILSQNIIPHNNLLVSRNTVTTTTKTGIGLVIEHCPLKLMKIRANTNCVFTINTILYDVKTDVFLSSVHSLTDLRNRVVKTAHNPEDAVKLKPTIMIDACGLLALSNKMRLGEKTEAEINKRFSTIDPTDKIQKLHIKMSLLKIMEYQIPSRALRKMQEIGILKIVLPELNATVDVIQNRHHNIYYCPDCDEFHTLNRSDYQKWDATTVKDDIYTSKVLAKYRKE